LQEDLHSIKHCNTTDWTK